MHFVLHFIIWATCCSRLKQLGVTLFSSVFLRDAKSMRWWLARKCILPPELWGLLCLFRIVCWQPCFLSSAPPVVPGTYVWLHSLHGWLTLTDLALHGSVDASDLYDATACGCKSVTIFNTFSSQIVVFSYQTLLLLNEKNNFWDVV